MPRGPRYPGETRARKAHLCDIVRRRWPTEERVEDIADELGITENYVYQLAKEMRLPHKAEARGG